jgi:TolB-like protein
LAVFGLVAQACAAGPGVGTGVSPAVARADSIARAAIERERTVNVASIPQGTIGIAPLLVQAADTTLAPLGYGLADLLTTDLARSRSLRVVERLQMDALMRELARAGTGRVDTATAPRVGRILGARQIVTGSIIQLPDTRVSINTRLADVSRGTVGGAEASTVRLDAILDAEKQLAYSLFERLGVTLSPAERALVDQRPTRNIAALLAYSRGVRSEALGDYGAAAREYRNASRLDPAFDRARTKQQAAEREVSAAAGSSAVESDQLKRTLNLTAEPINRSGLPVTSDAADPSFRANVQQLVTIIIRVTIP